MITGMSGRFGQRLLRSLHRKRSVIGLDRRPLFGLPEDVLHVPADPLRSGATQAFRRPDLGAILHLGAIHDPHRSATEQHSHSLLAFQRVLENAERFEIPKVILLSSANAYGPRAENPQFLTERAPLLASGRSTEMHTVVELDMHAQTHFWRSPKIEIVILRPANILGSVQNAPSNYLRLPIVPTLLGFDPMVQAVHQQDVIQALHLALRPGVKGVYNIAGPPPVPLSRVLRLLDRRTVSVPHPVLRQTLGGLFRFRLTQFPAPEVDFIRYVCMVDDSLARSELGYKPQFDLGQTLNAIDRERWYA